jgi:predicted ATP-grasp superfamily ATP-dependent carboligase
LGHYVNALGIIRSLGAVGLASICVSEYRGIAGWSRYTHFYKSPSPIHNPKAAKSFLIRLGQMLPAKGVLFTTKDEWLALVSRYWSELSTYYLQTMSSWDIISRALDKYSMYALAKSVGIPVPKLLSLPEGMETWETVASEIPFPCIIKPIDTVGFQKQLGSAGRVLQADNLEELVDWYQRMRLVGLEKNPILLQARIDGPVENLYTVTAYSDVRGDIRGYSIGHKIHQYPYQAGTITSGRVHDEPQVYALTARLIKALRFRGISNTEFKLDDSDGCFKLMEINCRPGKWNSAAHFAGVNLPYMAYKDAIQPQSLSKGKQVGQQALTWIHLNGEVLSYLAYVFDTSAPWPQRLSVRSWWGPMKGRKILAVESLKDPFPMLM